ncbi:hypothetical protein GF327_05515 [Candidatus Woesearchaeota archaeon]|nr:hypothetical protein [Candidatus Woesearchaeota archaeon]
MKKYLSIEIDLNKLSVVELTEAIKKGKLNVAAFKNEKRENDKHPLYKSRNTAVWLNSYDPNKNKSQNQEYEEEIIG